MLVPPCSCPPALYHAMIWGVRYLRGWRSVAECNKTLEVYASLRFVREKESSTAASSRAGSRSASIVLKNPAPCPCPVPSILCPLSSASAVCLAALCLAALCLDALRQSARFVGFPEQTPSNLKGLRTCCRMCPDLMDFPKNTVKFEGFATNFAYFLLDFARFVGFSEEAP